jgi:V/A-type H+-transporting ATPase subunit D
MKTRAAPTRAELLRVKRLASRVDQGAQLLRRKREQLVRALVPLARPAADARRAINETAVAAYRAEHDALAVHGEAAVAATAWPSRNLEVELDLDRVWGVTLATLAAMPVFERDLEARATAPSSVGPALFDASNLFELLASQLLHAIEGESHVRALGSALARTARQLHTLEQRVAPELAARAAAVSSALDERDREDQLRLRLLRRAR